jgi:D-3-phosphoglycerate dehydrogenase
VNNKYLIVDFDSTFIQVEALDELAAIALADHPESESVVEKIKTITAQGMEGKISLSESLASRIKLLSANKNHIAQLVEILKDKVSPSFKRNVAFLNQFSDNVYIVSSGFKEYIEPIVTLFGIKASHIFLIILLLTLMVTSTVWMMLIH